MRNRSLLLSPQGFVRKLMSASGRKRTPAPRTLPDFSRDGFWLRKLQNITRFQRLVQMQQTEATCLSPVRGTTPKSLPKQGLSWNFGRRELSRFVRHMCTLRASAAWSQRPLWPHGAGLIRPRFSRGEFRCHQLQCMSDAATLLASICGSAGREVARQARRTIPS